MGRRGPLAAEVEDGRDQRLAEVPRPDVIDRHAGRQRIASGRSASSPARCGGRCSWSGNGLRSGRLGLRGSTRAVFSAPRQRRVRLALGASSALRAAARAAFAAASFFSAGLRVLGFGIDLQFGAARVLLRPWRRRPAAPHGAASMASAFASSAGRLPMASSIGGGPRLRSTAGWAPRGREGLLGDGDCEPGLIERRSSAVRRRIDCAELDSGTERVRCLACSASASSSRAFEGRRAVAIRRSAASELVLEHERPQTRLRRPRPAASPARSPDRPATGTPGARARVARLLSRVAVVAADVQR